MAVSVRDVYAFIVSLGDDATLQSLGVGANDIFALKAPENHPTPFLLIERPVSRYHYTMPGNTKVYENWLVIKSITFGPDGGDLGRQIMDRVNELCLGATFSVTGGYVIRVEPVTELEYVDAEAGNIQYFHIGTMFKFLVGVD